jgi:glycosyltransferase involved in cell wall biosynthesis
VDIDKEIIVIDDGSTDDTGNILRDIRYAKLKVIHHTSNRGKGAAFLTGLSHARGEFIIIQDADLEYDPDDYAKLINEKADTDLVLGVRFTKGYHGLLLPRLGNRFLATFLNLLFHSNLNDFFSCYKLSKRQTMLELNLTSNDFNIDVEIITKALKKGLRIKQIPISYQPRSYSQGKKIRIKDGLKALLSIIKARL